MIQIQSGTASIVEGKLHKGNEPKQFVYLHGGDIRGAAEKSGRNEAEFLDFSANINPLGMPPGVREAIIESLDRSLNYPDPFCRRLRAALSEKLGQPEDYILCGNGGAELFFAVVMAVRPKKALVTAPAFSEYERALGTVGAEVQYYRLKEEQDFRIQEDILEQITEDTDMIFLCNPNNPTGQTTEKELLIRVMNRCNKCGTILVLDECFIEFLEEPERYECREYLTQYPNVVIIKAFTKIFCMPGVRLGYALCENAALRKRMRAMLQPWNVSVTAQEAGVAALVDCEAYLKRTREYIKKEKFWMTERMRKLGLNVWGSEANYIFFKGKAGLYEKALKSGLLIRDCSNYEGLTEGHYRIAIRSEEENERLITWLEKL